MLPESALLLGENHPAVQRALAATRQNLPQSMSTTWEIACQGLCMPWTAWVANREVTSLAGSKEHLEIGCALQTERLVIYWDSFGVVNSLSIEVFQPSLGVTLKRQRFKRNHGHKVGRKNPKGECCAQGPSRYLLCPADALVSLKGVTTTGKALWELSKHCEETQSPSSLLGALSSVGSTRLNLPLG